MSARTVNTVEVLNLEGPVVLDTVSSAAEVRDVVTDRTKEIICVPRYNGNLNDLEELVTKDGYYLCFNEEGNGAHDGEDMYLRLATMTDKIGVNIHLMDTDAGYGIETQGGIIILDKQQHPNLYQMIYIVPHKLGERKQGKD